MAKISSKTIDEISNVADFVTIVENYTHLEKRGSTWWGCCPFHNEKTPSFQVEPSKKMFYCFGCQKGGGLFKFLMEVEHIQFTEAVKRLADKLNIPVVYEGGNYEPTKEDKLKKETLNLYEKVANSFHYILLNTKMGKEALLYLQNRNVSQEIIEEFKLGFSPANRRWLFQFLQKKGYSAEFLANSGLFSKKYPEVSFFSNRVMFPIADRHGQIIAFGGRTLVNSEKSPKYLNSSDMPQYQKKDNLFGLHIAISEIRKQKQAILCEGYMDVLAFHQAGIKIAVAPLGTALTESQVKTIKPFIQTLYLSFDSDLAGQNATYKAIKLCANLGITTKVLSIENGKDPAEILSKDGAEGLNFLLKNAIIDSDYLVKTALDRFDLTSPDEKSKACTFLFPYLESLDSDIKRESMMSKISNVMGISQASLYSDYRNRNSTNRKEYTPETPVVTQFKQDAETRAVLAVIANPELFTSMRAELSSDDFRNVHAKELFIILEECYRDESITYESILEKCSNELLRTAITESVVNGEFSNNAEEIISDGVKYIKRNILKQTRDSLLGRLRLLHGNDNIGDSALVERLMTEINNIDSQLSKLRGERV